MAAERGRRFDAATKTDMPFEPTVRDGRRSVGLDIPWSSRADTAGPA
jgi:hypothetical protein